jgi:hypothetical protein
MPTTTTNNKIPAAQNRIRELILKAFDGYGERMDAAS